MPINPALVTTAFDLPGYRLTRNFSLVRGIVVRSRSIVGTIGASLQTLVGGNISLYTELCEKARADAYRLMMDHAAEAGLGIVVVGTIGALALAVPVAIGLLRLAAGLTLLLRVSLTVLAARAVAPPLVVALAEATHRLDHAEIVIGILPVRLRHDPIARRRRLASARTRLRSHDHVDDGRPGGASHDAGAGGRRPGVGTPRP